LENLEIYGRIILELIVKKQDVRMWTEFILMSIEKNGGHL
jgi:hypothetical protein